MAAAQLYLTLSGNGTQILSGTDTYSGPTAINSGTLQIGDGGTTGSLGNGSGSGTGGGTVTNDGALVFDLSGNSTVPNAIQGTGSLSQIGTGTTTLTASNSYGGGTFVSSGTLATALGGTLGTGPVNVSGGVLNVSSAPLSIGALTVGSGGTLNVAIGKLLTSTGAAGFGGTLNISGTPSGNLDELVAFSGSPTGIFANVSSEPNYALLYTTGQLDLVSYNSINAASGMTTTINGSVDLLGGQLPLSGGGSTVINGSLILDRAQVQMSNGSSMTINGQPILNGGSVVVNSGSALTLNNNTNTPATSSGAVTITVAPGATLQLAGTASALTSAVNVTNNASATGPGVGGVQVTGTNQVVGVISGTGTTNPDGSATYSGDTVVGPGANLTATQILQNTLTIGANSTVTIAPSSGAGGAVQTDANATVAPASSAASADSSGSSSGSDPLTAIQAAIAAGSITSEKGQQLENRLAAIERLATTDPGLDVSLLESRILAALPSSSILPSTDSSSLIGADSGLLAVDGGSFGSASSSALGGAARPSHRARASVETPPRFRNRLPCCWPGWEFSGLRR